MNTEALPPKKPLSVLIIGTGMYVSGRGTTGHGTIIPAVLQARQSGMVDKLLVAASSGASFSSFDEKLKDFTHKTGIRADYQRFPQGTDKQPNAYLDALESLSDPAAVIIVTPDHLHYDMAMAAIEFGKPVLVVKPLAPTVKQATALTAAAERHGVYAAVEFHKRWDLANIKLREIIRQGAIGEPLYFHVEYSQRGSIPEQSFAAWADKTTIFQYLGVHYADIIYFATGRLPRRVMALGQRRRLQAAGIDTWDAMQVMVEWDGGFTSSFLTNWIESENSTAVSQQAIKVVGTRGRFESDQTDRGVTLVIEGGCQEKINPYFCQAYGETDGRLIYRGYGIESVRQFLEDVQDLAHGSRTLAELAALRPTFRDALVSTAIVEAANLSAENDGAWVVIEESGLAPRLT